MMRLYQLFDSLAEDSGPVFEAKNDNVARRTVVEASKGSPVGLAQFTLYFVGTRVFDEVGVTAFPPVVVPLFAEVE